MMPPRLLAGPGAGDYWIDPGDTDHRMTGFGASMTCVVVTADDVGMLFQPDNQRSWRNYLRIGPWM